MLRLLALHVAESAPKFAHSSYPEVNRTSFRSLFKDFRGGNDIQPPPPYTTLHHTALHLTAPHGTTHYGWNCSV